MNVIGGTLLLTGPDGGDLGCVDVQSTTMGDLCNILQGASIPYQGMGVVCQTMTGSSLTPLQNPDDDRLLKVRVGTQPQRRWPISTDRTRPVHGRRVTIDP